MANLRTVTRRDGKIVVKLQCPGCGHWIEVSDGQLHGRFSVDHSDCGCGCTYHDTQNFAADDTYASGVLPLDA